MCKPNGSKTSVRKEGEGTQTPKSPEAVPGLRSIQQWAVVLQQRAALLNGAGLAEKGENTVFFLPVVLLLRRELGSTRAACSYEVLPTVAT